MIRLRKISSIAIAVFILIMISFGTYGQSGIAKTDSLEKLLSLKTTDSTQIKLLEELSYAYLKTDPEEAVNHAEEALQKCRDENIEPSPSLYRILGNAYDALGKSAKAIESIQEAILILKKSNDSSSLIAATNLQGWLHLKTGSFMESKKYFMEGLELANTTSNEKEKTNALYGLVSLYGSLENRELQNKYLEEYLLIADPVKETRRVAMAWMIKGDYNREQDQYNEAVEMYNKSYDYAEKDNDSIIMGLAINRIAWTFYEKGELYTSLEYYQRNLDLSIPINRQMSVTNIYGNIGNIYRDWHDYEKALEFYDKSIDLSEEIGDKYNLSWIYSDIAKMYAETGDFEKAYNYFQLHTEYNDSLMNQRYENKMIEARARYESEKSEQELKLLSFRLRQNRVITYSLVGGLILILIILALVLQRSRLRANQRLTLLQHTISELNQQNLRQQMNPHFVFNTLNSIQYYVFQNDKIAANNYMSKFAALMRKTLENSRHPAIPIKDELDALELYLDLESLRFKEKFEWSIKLDEEIDTLLFKIPTMLIQPYVENSLSHGLMHKEGKGYVHIELKLGKDEINCIIEDNGIGRKKAMEIKETRNSNHNSLGTTITESRLKLVNEIYGKSMKIIYKDLYDGAEQPSGTRVEISIPIIT